MTISFSEKIDAARFQRVKALYRVLSRISEDDRAELLERLCPDDAWVRRLVARLIDEPPPRP